MKNFLIDGIWQGPPDGFVVKDWLNEVVAYTGLDEYLQPTGVIRRFQKIKRGAAVCTRDGRQARIICFDVDNPLFSR